MNNLTTPAPQSPRFVRDVMVALCTAAAAWGAVKVEMDGMVKAETAVATIALRSDAAGEIAHTIDSATTALDHRINALFDTLRTDIAFQLASLPEPETITRTVLVPGPPDSTQAATLTRNIAHLDDLMRELAREGARQRTQFNAWQDWMRRNGFGMRNGGDKRNGDGH